MARKYKYIENVSDDILHEVIDIINGFIEVEASFTDKV